MGDYKSYLKKGSIAISERSAQRYRVQRNINDVGFQGVDHQQVSTKYFTCNTCFL